MRFTRYLLGALTVAIAVSGVWLVAVGSRHAVSNSSSGTQLAAAMPTALPFEPARSTPDPVAHTSRENLISRATGLARAMGEPHAQLKGFYITTLGGLSDVPGWGDPVEASIGSGDRRVYAVQVAGSFTPMSEPPPSMSQPPPLETKPAVVNETPIQGVLTIVFDAETGRLLGSSFP
jgi:hypothetical protein